MSRSIFNLRQWILGIAFVGAMGFGASQAFATAELAASDGTCPFSASGPYFYQPCDEYCWGLGYSYGYCENGSCVCGGLTGS